MDSEKTILLKAIKDKKLQRAMIAMSIVNINMLKYNKQV